MQKLVIGTRGSKLALAQTKLFAMKINKYKPDLDIKIKPIKTSGDRIKDKSLYKIGGKGLFVKEIEESLFKEEIDIAVHSLKDIPGITDDRLVLACYPERENPADVLISSKENTLDNLPRGSVLGTGSLRRQIQLKQYRPDLEFIKIRGNVDTRIKKMKNKNLDGIILAAAGLHRLDMKKVISDYISYDICTPAAGQGTLGIQILKKRKDLLKFLKKFDHKKTRLASIVERNFIKSMGSSCNLPVGAFARIEIAKNNITCRLETFYSDKNGEKYIKDTNKLKLKDENNIKLLERKFALFGIDGARQIKEKSDIYDSTK